MRRLRSERGMILAIAIMNIMVMMAFMAALEALVGGSYKRGMDMMPNEVDSWNKAITGIYEAKWRIRTNYAVDMQPANSDFTDPTWDPLPKYMDIETFTFSNGQRPGDDVYFDIGPEINGERTITAGGLTVRGQG